MNHETIHGTDEAKIRTLFEDLLGDWGRGDGETYGSRFTEDADYVAFDGRAPGEDGRSPPPTSNSSTNSSRARGSRAAS